MNLKFLFLLPLFIGTIPLIAFPGDVEMDLVQRERSSTRLPYQTGVRDSRASSTVSSSPSELTAPSPSSTEDAPLALTPESPSAEIEARVEEAFHTGDSKNRAWVEASRDIQARAQESNKNLDSYSAFINDPISFFSRKPLTPEEQKEAQRVVIKSIVLHAKLVALQQSAAARKAMASFGFDNTIPMEPISHGKIEAYNAIVEKLTTALQSWKDTQKFVISRKKTTPYLKGAIAEAFWKDGLEKLDYNTTSYEITLADWTSNRDLEIAITEYKKTGSNALLLQAQKNRSLLMEKTQEALENAPDHFKEIWKECLAKLYHTNNLWNFEMMTENATQLYQEAMKTNNLLTFENAIGAKEEAFTDLEAIETFTKNSLQQSEMVIATNNNTSGKSQRFPEEGTTEESLRLIENLKTQQRDELLKWQEDYKIMKATTSETPINPTNFEHGNNSPLPQNITTRPRGRTSSSMISQVNNLLEDTDTSSVDSITHELAILDDLSTSSTEDFFTPSVEK